VVKATLDALRQLEGPDQVAGRRGKSTEEIGVRPQAARRRKPTETIGVRPQS
jgi:hypothetical protein